MTAISLVVHVPLSVRGADINSSRNLTSRNNTADSSSLRTVFLSWVIRIGDWEKISLGVERGLNPHLYPFHSPISSTQAQLLGKSMLIVIPVPLRFPDESV
jgi:hypothetical protein